MGARVRPPAVPSLRLPPWRGLRALQRDPLGLLERGAALGDVVAVRLPRVDAVLLNHPDLVRDVLQTGHRDFRKGRRIEDIKRVLGDGLLTSEGDLHKRQRRLIQPIFAHDRIAGAGETMVRLTRDAPRGWTDGTVVDVHAEMQRLTLAIVGATLFGTDVGGEQARGVRDAMAVLLRGFDRLNTPYGALLERLPLPLTRRVAGAQRFLDGAIDRMVAERRSAGLDGDDVLSLLLRAEEDGRGMSDRQVRDEAMTLFLAGHETTSNALAFAWHLLGEHPEAEAALHRELDEVLGGRPPTVSDLPRLRVAEAIAAESMRLYPPSWVLGRRALVDHEVDGVTIPAGAIAVVSQWLVHRDARWWPEPAAFRLDRWTEDARAERPRFAYFPFGGGPRLCIGEPFAWMELQLVLATLAQRWRFRPSPGPPLRPEALITLRPAGGLRMRALSRDPSPRA